MGIAPLLQYTSGIMPFGWMNNQDDQMSFILTNALLLLCIILYRFSRRKTIAINRLSEIKYPDFSFDLPFVKRYKSWGILIYIIAIILQVYLSGNLWNRQLADETTIIVNSSVQLFADKSLKGIILYFCLVTIQLYKQKIISKPEFLFLLGLGIIANFPTAIPRYWLATFYLGIIIPLIASFLYRHKHRFSLLFVSGLLLLFPLINLIRWKKSQSKDSFDTVLHSIKSLFQLFTDSFCRQDFDAYASLRNTILYTQVHGLSWGRQLTTTFLFFVPRKVWPDKSIGSGAVVNPPRPYSDFHNYSSPLFAEGYIDFGIFGALVFTVLFSLLLSKYDNYYWYNNKNTYTQLFYPAYLGLAFFTLRGDLLSSFAYTIGIFLSGWIFHVFLLKSNKS